MDALVLIALWAAFGPLLLWALLRSPRFTTRDEAHE